MKKAFGLLALGGAVALVGLAGCATHKSVFGEAQRAAFRKRAETHFARAFYLKPSETSNATAQARLLAPLLILEVRDTNAPPDSPASATFQKIFSQPSQTILNGKPHEQMTYWWTYPKHSGQNRDLLSTQGIRITLGTTRRPVVWEVLADTSGAQIIFVAQSLEAQADREFGGPLAGRRFAVERSSAGTPRTVVARVIEDGPLPMGPIVYLRADTHDVTTVICRCMVSQSRELAGQQEYDLVSTSTSLPKLERIERRIRLPANF